MGFKPSKADPDIWMKSSKDGSHYEYIAVYVDDLAICMKDPKSFCDTLKEKYKLKLKGVVTEVWILQGICPLKDEWVFGCSLKTRLADQTKTQQLKWLWSNDTKDSTINQRLVEQIQEETLSWKVVEVLPW